jgi:hypothetical protein
VCNKSTTNLENSAIIPDGKLTMYVEMLDGQHLVGMACWISTKQFALDLDQHLNLSKGATITAYNIARTT